jgi:hypothetical protein
VVPNSLVGFDEGVVMLLIVSWSWSSRYRGENRGGSMRYGRWNIKSRYRIECLIVNVPRLVSDAVGLGCSRP